MTYGTAIFRDDSTADDKRAAAVERLMRLCPAPLRPIMQPQVATAINNCSDAEVSSLMIDVERVVNLAESGDPGALPEIIGVAKRYGATDQQVAAFQAAVVPANASIDPYEQFGAFLPGGR